LSRSKLINPYTHWDIMEKYCGNMDGVEGYYLTIMLSCLKLMWNIFVYYIIIMLAPKLRRSSASVFDKKDFEPSSL